MSIDIYLRAWPSQASIVLAGGGVLSFSKTTEWLRGSDDRSLSRPTQVSSNERRKKKATIDGSDGSDGVQKTTRARRREKK